MANQELIEKINTVLSEEFEVDIENIKKLVFPHPTVCEIVREAIFSI